MTGRGARGEERLGEEAISEKGQCIKGTRGRIIRAVKLTNPG